MAAVACCASVNPFNVPEGQGAFLQNQRVRDGSAVYRNRFIHANGEYLDVGLFSNENVDTATYTIPSGEVSVNIMVDYYPRMPPVSLVPRGIRVIMPFVAVEGQTYRIDCRVRDNLAHVWIEDAGGNQVSETAIVPDEFGRALPSPTP